MTDVTETATIKPGSWRELLGRERIGTATLLAGGVGLYATNEFLTISLLPSTVADIGGQRFRTVQGAAGGMPAGHGYAEINAALPNWLWTRASALVSAMWGVSVIVGPAMGGIFAQFGIWRWAFGSLAVLTVAL